MFQFSGGVDWRAKLDSQRGAVLATELKNNSCKIAKWTASALLAGSDIIKFGSVIFCLSLQYAATVVDILVKVILRVTDVLQCANQLITCNCE